MPLREKKNITYLAVSRGKLRHKPKGRDPIFYDEVEGRLLGVSLGWDPGNAEKKVKPHTVLEITIDDGDNEYMIEAAFPSVFGRMVARQMRDLELGETYTLRVWAAGEVDTASCGLFTDRNGQRVPQSDWTVIDNQDAKDAEATAWVKASPAYIQPRARRTDEQRGGTTRSDDEHTAQDRKCDGITIPARKMPPFGYHNRKLDLKNELGQRFRHAIEIAPPANQVNLARYIVGQIFGSATFFKLEEMTEAEAIVTLLVLNDKNREEVEAIVSRAVVKAKDDLESYDPFSDD